MGEGAHLVLEPALLTSHDKAGTEMNTTTTFFRGDMMDHKQINQDVLATRKHLRRLNNEIHAKAEHGWVAVSWTQPMGGGSITGIQYMPADLQTVARHINHRTGQAPGAECQILRPSAAADAQNDFAEIIKASSGAIYPWWLVH